ncbi:MAG: OstA-like protein [Flavobacteriales bacterium]
MIRFQAFLVALLLLSGTATPQDDPDQERIRLIHANSLEFDRSMGTDARRLIGDVRFKHGKATMDCDSAYLYSGKERLKAYGNVHIIHNDSIHLYGDSLRYDGSERKARLRSNVKVKDPEMTLRTDTLVYDISRSTAFYRGGGKLKVHDSQQRLKSRRGTYYADIQRMHFEEDVRLKHPDYRLYSDTLEYETTERIAHFEGPTVMRTGKETVYCEGGWYNLKKDRSMLTEDPYVARKASVLKADTLRYRREGGKGKAVGRVYLRNGSRALRAFSGKGTFRRGASWVRLIENPVLVRRFEEDTLYLRADTIRAKKDSITKKFRVMAYPRVRFFRRDLQGKCDSMSYEERDSTARLFQEPVLWSGKDRIAGDTVLIRSDGEGVSSLEIPSDPFLSSRKDSTYFDQMKGKEMKAWFSDRDRIRRIMIRGNGRTIHFPKEKGKEEGWIGMNRTESAHIDIRFQKGKMRSIRFIQKPTATLYPMKDLEKGMLHLKGFRWNEKGRARQPEDVMRGAWIHGRDRLRR